MITTTTGIGLAYGVQALSLTNNIVTLIQNARKNGKANGLGLADIVNILPAEAFKLAEEFIKQVTELKTKFLKEEIDLKQYIDDYECYSGWWKSRHDKLLIDFQATINDINAKLANFMDEVVAVARCSGEEELLGGSFQEARKLKKKLRKDTDFDNNTIGEIFDNLINHAEDLKAKLGDMIKK